jgi:L-lactate dehydrogenase
MPERRKVSVIGAGSVGATVAYVSLIRGAPKTVVLFDIDRDKVRAEVLDLNQGSQSIPRRT